MKAAVTGGAGFIGSHLVDLLRAEGWDTVVVDDLSSGRLENVQGPLREADVADPGALKGAFEGCDAVFHLAGKADIVPSIEKPRLYHRVNVDGTVNVLEEARAAGVKRLIYAASSSCYGIPDAYPTAETAAIRPQYPYALTKRLGEEAVLHWGEVYGMKATSLRLFNVYGPRSRTSGAYGAVLGVFLAQKLAGKPLTIVGDGEQVRDFTYVSDVARAFLLAAMRDLPRRVYNVGTGAPQSVNRLAELIGGDRVSLPKRPGEPERTQADASAFRRDAGWAPQVSFEDGVRRTVERIEDWKDAPVWTEASIAKATERWFELLGGDEA